MEESSGQASNGKGTLSGALWGARGEGESQWQVVWPETQREHPHY